MENNAHLKIDNNCIFMVDFSEDKPKLKQPPGRLLKHQTSRRKKPTKEELERMLEEAATRRQKHEERMIARIQERSEECRKIDEKVKVLLEQDALRKQLPGSENIKPMSKSQVSKAISSVAKDLQNINLNINSGLP